MGLVKAWVVEEKTKHPAMMSDAVIKSSGSLPNEYDREPLFTLRFKALSDLLLDNSILPKQKQIMQ